MGKNFIPRIYQRARDRAQNKKPVELFSDPLYKVTGFTVGIFKYTKVFEIGFSVDTDTNQVYEALSKEFGDIFDKYSRWMYLYTINLKTKLTWDEIFIRVNHALKDVVFDVIG